MRTTVRIEGFAELEAALAALPKATGKNVMKRVLALAAEPVVAAAEANAPVLTGTLRDNVQAGTKLTRRQAALAKRLGKSTTEIHVGSADPAGMQDEFGNQHQPARPWFRPAWDASANRALELIKSGLGEEITKTADRLSRRAAKRAAKG